MQAKKQVSNSIPKGSMYGIFTYIYYKNQPNVGKYSIHGWYGICFPCLAWFPPCLSPAAPLPNHQLHSPWYKIFGSATNLKVWCTPEIQKRKPPKLGVGKYAATACFFSVPKWILWFKTLSLGVIDRMNMRVNKNEKNRNISIYIYI